MHVFIKNKVPEGINELTNRSLVKVENGTTDTQKLDFGAMRMEDEKRKGTLWYHFSVESLELEVQGAT